MSVMRIQAVVVMSLWSRGLAEVPVAKASCPFAMSKYLALDLLQYSRVPLTVTGQAALTKQDTPLCCPL